MIIYDYFFLNAESLNLDVAIEVLFVSPVETKQEIKIQITLKYQHAILAPAKNQNTKQKRKIKTCFLPSGGECHLSIATNLNTKTNYTSKASDFYSIYIPHEICTIYIMHSYVAKDVFNTKTKPTKNQSEYKNHATTLITKVEIFDVNKHKKKFFVGFVLVLNTSLATYECIMYIVQILCGI